MMKLEHKVNFVLVNLQHVHSRQAVSLVEDLDLELELIELRVRKGLEVHGRLVHHSITLRSTLVKGRVPPPELLRELTLDLHHDLGLRFEAWEFRL